MDKEHRQLKLNGKIIYSLEELKENFNAEELVAGYKDGSLIRWLEFFFYGKIADKVRAVNPDKNLIEQLTHIFTDSNENCEPRKIFMHVDEKLEENHESREDIFDNAETLMKEAENYYAEKNYREAVKKYMEVYCLGNDEAVDKLHESLNALLKSEKRTDSTEIEARKKSHKIVSIIATILAVTTIIFSLGYFQLLNKIQNFDATLNNERTRYVNDTSVLKQQLDKTKRDLENARKEIDRLSKLVNKTDPASFKSNVNGSQSTIHASNSNIRGDRNIIDGNNNDIYGDDNKIYGNDNRVYGNRNEVIKGKNNTTYGGAENKGFSN